MTADQIDSRVTEKKQPGDKLNKLARRQHLARVSELYCQGKYQHEIAAELGCTQQQVSYDLRMLQRHWQQVAITNIHEARLRELAKIDRLEREYWDAFDRSKQVKETKQFKDKGKSKEKSLKHEGQIGDPRYLEGVQWCITKRAELLGLDKADEDNASNMERLAEAVAASWKHNRDVTIGAAQSENTGSLTINSPVDTDT